MKVKKVINGRMYEVRGNILDFVANIIENYINAMIKVFKVLF